MAEAEQEENVRRPRAHALDRDQRLVGVLGVEIAEALEVEAALDLRLGDRPQGADFGADNPQARNSSSVALAISSRLERDDARLQPAEYGGSRWPPTPAARR